MLDKKPSLDGASSHFTRKEKLYLLIRVLLLWAGGIVFLSLVLNAPGDRPHRWVMLGIALWVLGIAFYSLLKLVVAWRK